MVTAMENGTSLLNKVLPKNIIDLMIQQKPDLINYIQLLADTHEKCKKNKGITDCDLPVGKVEIVPEGFRVMFDPPQLVWEVSGYDSNNKGYAFTPLQATVILNATKGRRVAVAQSFVPATARVIAFFDLRGYNLVSWQHQFQYDDGTVTKADETGGVGGFYWVHEPADANEKALDFEDIIYHFLAQHNGSFGGSDIIQLRDQGDRIFRMTLMQAKWTADGQNVNSIEAEILN